MELENILTQLGSDIARANAISSLVKNRKKVPENLIIKAVDVFEKAGRLSDAARVARELGLNERAVDVFEKAGRLSDAARVARELGLNERANKLYIQIIDSFEKAGDFYCAVEVAREAGMSERAKALDYLEKMLRE